MGKNLKCRTAEVEYVAWTRGWTVGPRRLEGASVSERARAGAGCRRRHAACVEPGGRLLAGALHARSHELLPARSHELRGTKRGRRWTLNGTREVACRVRSVARSLFLQCDDGQQGGDGVRERSLMIGVGPSVVG